MYWIGHEIVYNAELFHICLKFIVFVLTIYFPLKLIWRNLLTHSYSIIQISY